jgi:hypothetical protein
MVRVKFYVINDEASRAEFKAISFFVDMPARPMKGDTFIFNETISGLDAIGEERLAYLHGHEFGIQSLAWHYDEDGAYIEATMEPVL